MYSNGSGYFDPPWQVPQSETKLITSDSGFSGTAVGGTMPAILSDGSDLTFLQGNPYEVNGTGFVALSVLNTITSFVVTGRAAIASGTNSTPTVHIFTGIVVTPTSQTHTVSTTITDLVFGPFTKSGGGTWTRAQFNTMKCDFSYVVGSPQGMLYQLSVTATGF